VKEAGLLPEKATEIADYLEGLGAIELEDLGGLEDEHVSDLLKLVPPLRKNKFKERLTVYRPVQTLSLL
jgi:hypothetical protein